MIIADTGYWLALANQRDKYHQLAINKTKDLSEPLIVTRPVLTETCHLLLVRLGVDAQVKFISQITQFTDIFELTEVHLKRCAELMNKYRDLPMDLTDASLVVLAENLEKGKILSTDNRDFNTYRWKNHFPFENILLT